MGGGAGARTSPIDDLRLSMEMAGANRPDAKTRSANRATTAKDVMSVLPVIGHAMSADSAVDSYRQAIDAASKGDLKGTALSAGMGAVDTVGAVTGLPFGKAARAAAKGGKDRLNVFVPVEEGKLTQQARRLRGRGKPAEEVFDSTGLIIAPDGTVRRHIPDSYMDVDFSHRPGDVTTVGNLVNHPTLFRAMPELQNRIVNVTDKVDPALAKRGLKRGFARTDPKTGDFEYSIVGMDPFGDMAKLLQYDISDRVGFSAAGRHSMQDQIGDINRAVLDVARSPADRKAIQAYVDALDRIKADVIAKLETPNKGGGTIRYSDVSKGLSDRTAGNLDSKIVRGNAGMLASENPAGRFPYEANPPWVKGNFTMPSYEDMLVLPPAKSTPDDIAQFVEDWYRYGAGRGK
jgi:hypothetical protein